MTVWLNNIHQGDCRMLMRCMIADGMKVDCIVTSPPYWGLRDYGVPGQYGLERTWQRHVARMRSVFRLAHELLADDGTLWLNYGDSYSGRGGQTPQSGKIFKGSARQRDRICLSGRKRGAELKNKDLVGMPWRIAFALQADGWYLRKDIIWHKPNAMPESCKDRPTTAHEYIFLMSKSDRYFYNANAIREPVTGNAHARDSGVNPKAQAKISGWGQGAGVTHNVLKHATAATAGKSKFRSKQNESFSGSITELVEERNARSVWKIATESFAEAHFATFPSALVKRCLLAGAKPWGIVFDPFMGSGTTAMVAQDLGLSFIGLDINPDYIKMNRSRNKTLGLSI